MFWVPCYDLRYIHEINGYKLYLVVFNPVKEANWVSKCLLCSHICFPCTPKFVVQFPDLIDLSLLLPLFLPVLSLEGGGGKEPIQTESEPFLAGQRQRRASLQTCICFKICIIHRNFTTTQTLAGILLTLFSHDLT